MPRRTPLRYPIGLATATPLGVIRGACWYACPGPTLEQADWPNPPGAWKNELTPRTCKPVGPALVPITPAALEPAQPLALPNQTDPVPPQPFQPEDQR